MRPLVLTGPTGAGKSALSLALAERYGARILSMDAMAVYRGMDIGTSKPTPEERRRVPHFGLDLRDPDQEFSAADFVEEAERLIAAPDATSSSEAPLLIVGGSVFYLRALWMGLVPTPAVDPALRATLEALDDPHAALAAVDPPLAARLHPNDRVRIVRGLEVFHQTGRRLSELHEGDDAPRRPLEIVWVDREDLYPVIDRRVEAMMAAGYLEEVERLLAKGYGPSLKPMSSLGYRHLAAHLRGEIPLEEAVSLTARDSRRYARKQRGFLRSFGLAPGGDVEAAARRAFGA